ncbi:MAG: hypothetical protein BMS9Abin30_0630 [Gammaproteobacteria bacterium]|nr:MAG: hypothetical protein BMS9Abin30_0630 [Gammaproteobacteria bacterium]
MIFWLVITALIIFALIIVLGPFWRKKDVKTPDRTDLNIRLYKHRLSELETDLNNKVLDKDQYEQAVSELKLQLLSDVPENPENRKIAPRRSKQTIFAIVLLVPVLSIGLYSLLGNMDIATGNVDPSSRQGREIHDLVAALAQRLESQPDDVRGWVMLGRSYAVMEQADKAVAAFEKAYALSPEDPDVLTGLAETLALSNNNQLAGRSMELLRKALEINPDDLRTLWLAGYAEVQLGNNDQAIKYWQSLLSLLPTDDKAVGVVRESIARLGVQTDTNPIQQ